MKLVLDITNFLEILIFLGSLFCTVLGSCRFPQFLQRQHPWVGDYKDGRIIAYIRQTSISVTEKGLQFTRDCHLKAADKFLVKHIEDRQPDKYLCMQFLQRAENIVQIKTSNMFTKDSLQICEESGMAIDPFPLVNYDPKAENRITCPFTGGYNMYVYNPPPNNSVICTNLMLLMRMESECDQGEGITFDFRSESCIPGNLTRQLRHRAHCVAHWTQDSYTFIILQHAEVTNQWFCLRTADPLSNIRQAYLWLKVICDVSEKPSPEVSLNYLKLEFNKRIFSSTCADELEICQEMAHYCNGEYSRHCSHTCQKCLSENQIGVCTFDEQYRGRWVESTNHSDTIIEVEAYSLHSGHPGKYDCLNLNSDKMADKKVLLELYNNGCFPRYACVEMEKVTSSVMKFRLGNRITWPLSSVKNEKDEICKDDNFKIRDLHSPHFLKERPARLLVNVDNIREVPCGLPERLQNGIAFREDGKHCGGCLNYDTHVSPNHFTIIPVNCTDSSEKKGYRNVPLQYSCLATFEFYNNTFSVVTKTTTFGSGIGQYLVWVFAPNNQIMVMKAADTFVFELNSHLKPHFIQAQFSILRNDNLQCSNFVFLPRSTTTTAMSQELHENEDNGEDMNELYVPATTFPGIDHLTYNPRNGKGNIATGTPRYDNSKGERIRGYNSNTRISVLHKTVFLYTIIVAVMTWALTRTQGLQSIT